jgi:hypothetical protein
MSNPPGSTTVNDTFFAPVLGLAAGSKHWRPCPELPDEDWLLLNLHRVLEAVPSGRAFLQEHGPRFRRQPSRANYFDSLASGRRAALAGEVNLALIGANPLEDRLAAIPELARYRCFATDGHWHGPAVHDPKDRNGALVAVGHFYSLDLHDHFLRHLSTAQAGYEHDMTVLKRLKPSGLRQGVPKGTRVLLVHDRAGIDFGFWKRCRQECAVYFLSRVKERMVFSTLSEREVCRNDPRNRGVVADSRVRSLEGHELRVVVYQEPGTGNEYRFLTNEPDLPPGVIAELYRRRWEIEKVFDEMKNKLSEQRAWGSSLTAKESQGQLLAMTHNLMRIYQSRLGSGHGVEDRAEIRRRTGRIEQLNQSAKAHQRTPSSLLLRLREATQLSVKFIRWLRQSIRDQATEDAAVPRLNALLASL